MATRKPMEAFMEPEEDEAIVEEIAVEKEVVAPGAPPTKKGRVKGTWTMHWAGQNYPFVDKKVYDLPTDLYWYLRQNDAIYDTL